MNILLINPFITVPDLTVDLSEPLGLLYLATYTKEKFGKDINISILDLYEMGADKPVKTEDGYYRIGVDDANEIEKRVKEVNPDLIGVSCNFTAYVHDAIRAISIVHSKAVGVPIVMGGAHATMCPEELMKEYLFIDFIVRGEGEVTFEELINELKGEKNFEKINGLVYRNKLGRIIRNKDRDFIKDLDQIPIPKRSYIQMNRYSRFKRNTIWYTRKKPIAGIITSRGCPYDCIFCSTKVMWRRRWRGHSVKRIIQEIEYLEKEYNIKEVTIFDDQFFANKNRVHEFCYYFIKRDKKISFSYDSGTSPWLVDKEMLILLKKAGFYAIRFPIETGSIETLSYVKKPIDLQKTLELIKEANKIGFWTSGNFIIGFPYENREQIKETICYAYASKLDFASFIAARPHKGSEMYETFKSEGLLDKGIVHTSLYDISDYDTICLTAQEITDIIQQASRGWYYNKLLFYSNPYNFREFFRPKLKSWEDFLYMMRMFFKLLMVRVIPLAKKKNSCKGQRVKNYNAA